ncbi:ATP-binding protein [Micromonospora chersina]
MLYGRDDERRCVDALLRAARAGRSGVLVLRGEAGIGKTALLDDTAARAGRMVVLRGAAVETEAEVAFAGLHLILRPLLDRVDRLPRPQAGAVRRALFQADTTAEGDDPGARDRFLVGLAVLNLLADAAPAVCLVDDAQWLDAPSADTLTFVARRLDAEGVVMLFAAREGAGRSFPSAGLPERELSPLGHASSGQLVDDRAADLPRALRERVLAEAMGNPLALTELAASTAAGGAGAGAGTLPAPLPAGYRTRDVYATEIRALDPATQRALVVAAAEASGDLGLLVDALGRLGDGAVALVPAERAGLLSMTDQVRFRHPLVRSAAYHDAPLAWRQAAHAALAQALGRRDDAASADRRAWHLANAADGPDEQVAAELERAGDRARDRNGYAAASAAYEQAARLSPDREARAGRLLAAAVGAHAAGRSASGRQLADRARGLSVDPLRRAEATHLRLLSSGPDYGDDLALLPDAVAGMAGQHPARAAEFLRTGMLGAWLERDRDLSERIVAGLLALRMPPTAGNAIHEATLQWACFLAGRAGRPDMRSCLTELREHPERFSVQERLYGNHLAFRSGDDDAYWVTITDLVSDCRSRGMVGALVGLLSRLAGAQIARGHWADARATATEALSLGRDTDQPYRAAGAAGHLALLCALAGDESGCSHWLVEHGRLGRSPASQAAVERSYLAKMDLGRGDFAAAFEKLSSPGLLEEAGDTAFVFQPDLVEAAAHCGQTASARQALTEFTSWAEHGRHPWALAIAARCRGLVDQLLDDDTEAGGHYAEAVRLGEKGTRPFEQARTRLLYGEWLRRRRRRGDAREQLSAALDTFERLGAAPWAERARVEVRATGLAATRVRRPGPLAQLTPQEFQIVRLAAGGASNRHIAAQLFLSHRTVGYHLYKAYPKLGVSTRVELAALFDGADLGPGDG